MAEVLTCKDRLSKYCVGNGLDVGFGGWPIIPSAICLDRPETHPGREVRANPCPTQIIGDAADLSMFASGKMDYLFSSHVLEDFDDTTAVLKEWFRVLKSGGLLVLFLPDQPTYVAHCKAHNHATNLAHKHADFGPEYVKACLWKLGYGDSDIVELEWPFPGNPYSFSLVVRKP